MDFRKLALAALLFSTAAFPRAFPTAEGYGKDSEGARKPNALVIKVANVLDLQGTRLATTTYKYCEPGDPSKGGVPPYYMGVCSADSGLAQGLQRPCSSTTDCAGGACDMTKVTQCTSDTDCTSGYHCVVGPLGSMRRALYTPRPRFILPDVGGNIELGKVMPDYTWCADNDTNCKGTILDGTLVVNSTMSNFYLAGQYSPADSGGIAFLNAEFDMRTQDNELGAGASDSIIRFVRFRPGLAYGSHNADIDAVSTTGQLHVIDSCAMRSIFDHVELSWWLDEGYDLFECSSGTIQYSIIGPGTDAPHLGWAGDAYHGLSISFFTYTRGVVQNGTVYRNLLLDATGRSLKMGFTNGNYQYINNYLYNNYSMASNAIGYWIEMNFERPNPLNPNGHPQVNIINNMFDIGPQQGNLGARAAGGPESPWLKVYLAGNAIKNFYGGRDNNPSEWGPTDANGVFTDQFDIFSTQYGDLSPSSTASAAPRFPAECSAAPAGTLHQTSTTDDGDEWCSLGPTNWNRTTATCPDAVNCSNLTGYKQGQNGKWYCTGARWCFKQPTSGPQGSSNYAAAPNVSGRCTSVTQCPFTVTPQCNVVGDNKPTYACPENGYQCRTAFSVYTCASAGDTTWNYVGGCGTYTVGIEHRMGTTWSEADFNADPSAFYRTAYGTDDLGTAPTVPTVPAYQLWNATMPDGKKFSESVGAYLPKRDTLSARLISEPNTRDVSTSGGGIYCNNTPQGVPAPPCATFYNPPALATGTLFSRVTGHARTDTDGDGMPDDWEEQRMDCDGDECLDPLVANTVSLDANHNGYYDIEDYLNELAGDGVQYAPTTTACDTTYYVDNNATNGDLRGYSCSIAATCGSPNPVDGKPHDPCCKIQTAINRVSAVQGGKTCIKIDEGTYSTEAPSYGTSLCGSGIKANHLLSITGKDCTNGGCYLEAINIDVDNPKVIVQWPDATGFARRAPSINNSTNWTIRGIKWDAVDGNLICNSDDITFIDNTYESTRFARRVNADLNALWWRNSSNITWTNNKLYEKNKPCWVGGHSWQTGYGWKVFSIQDLDGVVVEDSYFGHMMALFGGDRVKNMTVRRNLFEHQVNHAIVMGQLTENFLAENNIFIPQRAGHCWDGTNKSSLTTTQCFSDSDCSAVTGATTCRDTDCDCSNVPTEDVDYCGKLYTSGPDLGGAIPGEGTDQTCADTAECNTHFPGQGYTCNSYTRATDAGRCGDSPDTPWDDAAFTPNPTNGTNFSKITQITGAAFELQDCKDCIVRNNTLAGYGLRQAMVWEGNVGDSGYSGASDGRASYINNCGWYGECSTTDTTACTTNDDCPTGETCTTIARCADGTTPCLSQSTCSSILTGECIPHCKLIDAQVYNNLSIEPSTRFVYNLPTDGTDGGRIEESGSVMDYNFYIGTGHISPCENDTCWMCNAGPTYGVTYNTLGDWQTAACWTGIDANSTYDADAATFESNLVNYDEANFRPASAGAPTVNAGSPVLDCPADDYDGLPRSGTCDVGAFEWRTTTPASCGDGTRDADEECDDNNVTPGDGCDASCAVETGYICTGSVGSPSVCATVCGDGITAGSEDCDPGPVTTTCCPVPGCTFTAASTPCQDGDQCTLNDTCDGAGTCDPGTARSCADTDACTDDSCDSSVGCIHETDVTNPGCGSTANVEDYFTSVLYAPIAPNYDVSLSVSLPVGDAVAALLYVNASGNPVSQDGADAHTRCVPSSVSFNGGTPVRAAYIDATDSNDYYRHTAIYTSALGDLASTSTASFAVTFPAACPKVRLAAVVLSNVNQASVVSAWTGSVGVDPVSGTKFHLSQVALGTNDNLQQNDLIVDFFSANSSSTDVSVGARQTLITYSTQNLASSIGISQVLVTNTTGETLQWVHNVGYSFGTQMAVVVNPLSTDLPAPGSQQKGTINMGGVY